MSLDFICEFCKSSFSTKSNLIAHKKRAKKCLVLQNNLSSKELFNCKECEKTFTKKQTLQAHIILCPFKTEKITRLCEKIKEYEIIMNEKNEQIKKQDIQIKYLQDKLENIEENVNLDEYKPE